MFRVLIIAFLININFIFSQDKGLEYYQNQEFEAAKNYYESIILESENPEAQLGKGSSSFQLGDYDSAKGAFEESLRSNDNIIRSKALYNLGNTLYQNQKNEEALAYYRKALELNPDDKEARYNYELLKYCKHIKKTIHKWVGIPVSIGIGPTKTLSKIANNFAKKK